YKRGNEYKTSKENKYTGFNKHKSNEFKRARTYRTQQKEDKFKPDEWYEPRSDREYQFSFNECKPNKANNSQNPTNEKYGTHKRKDEPRSDKEDKPCLTKHNPNKANKPTNRTYGTNKRKDESRIDKDKSTGLNKHNLNKRSKHRFN